MPAFSRRLDELAGGNAGAVLERIQHDLLKEPLRGKLVPGLGGIRKARAINPGRGKGKRGGYRYFYLYRERRGHIYLLFILDRNEQEGLAAGERTELRALVAELGKS